MRALCVGNSYGDCNMLVDQCHKSYINDICDAGKYKDIHRCNLAKAVTKRPSYYCDSYLKNCSFKGEDKDCNLALRCCDNKTIYSECKKNGIKMGSLCIGFRKSLIPWKYTKGQCNRFLSDCRMKYNSMAYKEVLFHCGKDDIKSICQEPNLWTVSMCQTTKY